MRIAERKIVAAEFKADVAKRRIEGYASVFGNIDGNDDIVCKGAYTDTLANDLPSGRIKVKRNHQILIGKPVHAEQDTKGLLTVSHISDTPLGNETLALVQDGVIDEMSIGFKTLDKAYALHSGRRVREVKAVKLYEWSFMDDPAANSEARVMGLKSLADASDALDEALQTVASLREYADEQKSLSPSVLERLDTLAADIAELKARTATENPSQYVAALASTVSSLNALLTSSTQAA